MADRIKDGADEDRLLEALSADKVQQNLSPDDRFGLVLKLATPEKPAKPQAPIVKMGDVGTMEKGKSELRIKLKRQHQVEFAEFLEEEMDALLTKYHQLQKEL